METHDRTTILGLVRARVPTFSEKQLKAVIAANPSLGRRRVPSGRGSAFVYPAELVPTAIAYARNSTLVRARGPRNIITWLARPQVPAAENRAMIKKTLAPYGVALYVIGYFSKKSKQFDENVKKMRVVGKTEHERARANIAADLLVSDSAIVAPRNLATSLQRDSVSLSAREQDYDERDERRSALTVSLRGFLEVFSRPLGDVPDDVLEHARLLSAEIFETIARVATDDSLANSIAREGDLLPAFMETSFYESLSLEQKADYFKVFAMFRPYLKAHFESVVKMMPLCVFSVALLLAKDWPTRSDET